MSAVSNWITDFKNDLPHFITSVPAIHPLSSFVKRDLTESGPEEPEGVPIVVSCRQDPSNCALIKYKENFWNWDVSKPGLTILKCEHSTVEERCRCGANFRNCYLFKPYEGCTDVVVQLESVVVPKRVALDSQGHLAYQGKALIFGTPSEVKFLQSLQLDLNGQLTEDEENIVEEVVLNSDVGTPATQYLRKVLELNRRLRLDQLSKERQSQKRPLERSNPSPSHRQLKSPIGMLSLLCGFILLSDLGTGAITISAPQQPIEDLQNSTYHHLDIMTSPSSVATGCIQMALTEHLVGPPRKQLIYSLLALIMPPILVTLVLSLYSLEMLTIGVVTSQISLPKIKQKTSFQKIFSLISHVLLFLLIITVFNLVLIKKVLLDSTIFLFSFSKKMWNLLKNTCQLNHLSQSRQYHLFQILTLKSVATKFLMVLLIFHIFHFSKAQQQESTFISEPLQLVKSLKPYEKNLNKTFFESYESWDTQLKMEKWSRDPDLMPLSQRKKIVRKLMGLPLRSILSSCIEDCIELPTVRFGWGEYCVSTNQCDLQIYTHTKDERLLCIDREYCKPLTEYGSICLEHWDLGKKCFDVPPSMVTSDFLHLHKVISFKNFVVESLLYLVIVLTILAALKCINSICNLYFMCTYFLDSFLCVIERTARVKFKVFKFMFAFIFFVAFISVNECTMGECKNGNVYEFKGECVLEWEEIRPEILSNVDHLKNVMPPEFIDYINFWSLEYKQYQYSDGLNIGYAKSDRQGRTLVVDLFSYKELKTFMWNYNRKETNSIFFPRVLARAVVNESRLGTEWKYQGNKVEPNPNGTILISVPTIGTAPYTRTTTLWEKRYVDAGNFLGSHNATFVTIKNGLLESALVKIEPLEEYCIDNGILSPNGDGFFECAKDNIFFSVNNRTMNCEFKWDLITVLKYYKCVDYRYMIVVLLLIFSPLIIWQVLYTLKQLYVIITCCKYPKQYTNWSLVEKNFSKFYFVIIQWTSFFKTKLCVLYPIWYLFWLIVSIVAIVPYWLFLLVLKMMCRKKRVMWFMFLFPLQSNYLTVQATVGTREIWTKFEVNRTKMYMEAQSGLSDIVSNETTIELYDKLVAGPITEFSIDYAPTPNLNVTDELNDDYEQISFQTWSGTGYQPDIYFTKDTITQKRCSFEDGKRICNVVYNVKVKLPINDGRVNLFSMNEAGSTPVGFIQLKDFSIKYDNEFSWGYSSYGIIEKRRISDCFASYGRNNPLYQNSYYLNRWGQHKKFVGEKSNWWGSGRDDGFKDDKECNVFELTSGRFFDNPTDYLYNPVLYDLATPCRGDGCAAWQCRSYLNTKYIQANTEWMFTAHKLGSSRISGSVIVNQKGQSRWIPMADRVGTVKSEDFTMRYEVIYDRSFPENSYVGVPWNGGAISGVIKSVDSFMVGGPDEKGPIFDYKCRTYVPYPDFHNNCISYIDKYITEPYTFSDFLVSLRSAYRHVSQDSSHNLVINRNSFQKVKLPKNVKQFQKEAGTDDHCAMKYKKFYLDDDLDVALLDVSIEEGGNLNAYISAEISFTDEIVTEGEKADGVPPAVRIVNCEGVWDRLHGYRVETRCDSPPPNYRIVIRAYTLTREKGWQYDASDVQLLKESNKFSMTLKSNFTQIDIYSINHQKTLLEYLNCAAKDPSLIIENKKEIGGNDNLDVRDKDVAMWDPFIKIGNFFKNLFGNWQNILYVAIAIVVLLIIFYVTCYCCSFSRRSWTLPRAEDYSEEESFLPRRIRRRRKLA